MRRPLNSDQLGKKGESRFAELCVDAGLTVNPSTWDRKGWDFIVQWDHAPTLAALDQRPAPPSCHVQVKTIWRKTRSIRLRLSSVEHLAKELRPAFIYVLKADDDLTFGQAAIAHLSGEFLAHILKALRQASAANTPPNRVEIDVALAKWFTPLEPTAAAFRSATEEAIGGTMAAYAERKQRQLNELGYGTGRLTMTTTLLAASPDDLVDAFLGLKPIEVSKAAATETRFGITLPLPGFVGSGIAEFQPKPRDTCKIIARPANGNAPFTFSGRMFGAPNDLMPAGCVKVLIRSELFSILMDARDIDAPREVNGEPADRTLTLTLSFEGLGKMRTSARTWADFYGFLAAVADEALDLEIQPKKTRGAITGKISASPSAEAASNWRYGARLGGAAKALFERAGWPGSKLAIRDLAKAEKDLFLFDALINDQSGLDPLTFSTAPSIDFDGSQTHEAVYFTTLQVGSHLMAYAVSAVMEGTTTEEGIDWRSRSLTVRDVSRIKDSDQAYRQYLEGARRRLGIEHYRPSEPASASTS